MESFNTRPKAVIVDVDMTLADNRWRHPYNFIEVGKDKPIWEVIDVVKELKASGYNIVILTGRWQQFQEMTEEWLNRYGIPYDACYFKPDNDFTHGYEWKPVILEQILASYDVKVFFDDDPEVFRGLTIGGLFGIRVIDAVIDQTSPGWKVLFGLGNERLGVPESPILVPPGSELHNFIGKGKGPAPYNRK